MIKLTLASVDEEVVAMVLIKDDSEILRIAVHESFIGQEGSEVQLNDAIPKEPIGVPEGHDMFNYMMEHFEGALEEYPPEDVETVGFLFRGDDA